MASLLLFRQVLRRLRHPTRDPILVMVILARIFLSSTAAAFTVFTFLLSGNN